MLAVKLDVYLNTMMIFLSFVLERVKGENHALTFRLKCCHSTNFTQQNNSQFFTVEILGKLMDDMRFLCRYSIDERREFLFFLTYDRLFLAMIKWIRSNTCYHFIDFILIKNLCPTIINTLIDRRR